MYECAFLWDLAMNAFIYSYYIIIGTIREFKIQNIFTYGYKLRNYYITYQFPPFHISNIIL